MNKLKTILAVLTLTTSLTLNAPAQTDNGMTHALEEIAWQLQQQQWELQRQREAAEKQMNCQTCVAQYRAVGYPMTPALFWACGCQ
jgi:hypothetical protein